MKVGAVRAGEVTAGRRSATPSTVYRATRRVSASRPAKNGPAIAGVRFARTQASLQDHSLGVGIDKLPLHVLAFQRQGPLCPPARDRNQPEAAIQASDQTWGGLLVDSGACRILTAELPCSSGIRYDATTRDAHAASHVCGDRQHADLLTITVLRHSGPRGLAGCAAVGSGMTAAPPHTQPAARLEESARGL